MTTVNLQVSAMTDDASEGAGGAVTVDSTTSTLAVAGSHLGFRFQSVPVPNGAAIDTAIVQVYVDSPATYDDIHLDVYGEDVDDSTAFTTDNFDISGRDYTDAKVDWDAEGVGEGWESSPSVATVVQEIVDRGSLPIPYDMNIICDGMADIALKIRMWDYAGNAHGAQLDIDYTEPRVPRHPAVIYQTPAVF